MPQALSPPFLLQARYPTKHLIYATGPPSALFLNVLLSGPVTSRRAMTSLVVANPRASRVVAARIPGLTPEETRTAVERAFRRHTAPPETKRGGAGVAIVWFRNDLRLLDNEVLCRAWAASDALVPVYFLDPRMFGKTHYFKFPKTGEMRARFLLECLVDLRKNLISRGLNLLVRHGRPEDVLPELAKAFDARAVFAQKETCREEVHVEQLVRKGLQQVSLPRMATEKSTPCPQLQLIWGSTMYHINDLPFETGSLPDVYTQFRKSVEAKSRVRTCHKLPMTLGPPPKSGLEEVGGWGNIPSLEDLGLQEKQIDKGLLFMGGETAALGRVEEHFWKKVNHILSTSV